MPLVERLEHPVERLGRKKLAEQGAEAYAEKPEQFAEFIRSESAKWSKVVKDSGAGAD